MLVQEENELLTRTGPRAPGGELLRRYWQPVALCEELPRGGPPKEVRLLGENLVLFRDDRGRPGLLGIHCSHRGADLSYGRVEDGGLRCIYHGWLYDVHGRCIEQPAEPKGSQYKEKIQHLAYPCQEAGGLVFTYMGPGDPPQLPAYTFLIVPESNRLVSKVFQECNYLQANEGEIDPAHVSYLHRFLKDDVRREPIVSGTDVRANALVGSDPAPRLEVEETDFGIRIFALRETPDGRMYIRISNFIYPNLAAFPANRPAGNGYSVHWHVPIDDTHHWKYNITHSLKGSLDEGEKERYRVSRADLTEDYHLKRNNSNRFLQDREEMKSKSFTGVGPSFLVMDACATEGQGAIQDRTGEHLGYSDKAIAMERRLLLKALKTVQEGGDPPHVIRDPKSNYLPHLGGLSVVVPSTKDWKNIWQEYVLTPDVSP
jgi:phthalate 4,5-dioxygenase